MHLVVSGNTVKRESPKKSEFEVLDVVLFGCYKCQGSEGVSMAGPSMKGKAQSLCNDLGFKGRIMQAVVR
jgi:hypothetical protein